MIRARWTVAATIFSVALTLGAGGASRPPNILWLSWEDCSPRLGCYGDPLARTPHLDAMAAAGVRFTNAFAIAPVCAPSRSSIITGMYPTSIGTHHMRCRTRLPDHIGFFPAILRKAGYFTTNNSKEDYQFPGGKPPGVWDQSNQNAHWRQRAAGQPFFAVFNFTRTHESQSHALDSNPPSPDDQAFVDPARVKVPPYLPDTQRVRAALAQHYRRIAALDAWIGGKLQELDRDGLAEETIVFCWSDHGDGQPRAKRWVYDSGRRVPLLVRVPAQWREQTGGRKLEPGSTDSRLVTLMDLGPTVLHLCGLKVPDHMHGWAFLGRGIPSPRQYVHGARDRMDESYDCVRSVNDGKWEYVRNHHPWRVPMPVIDYGEKHVVMQEIRRLAQSGQLPEACRRYLQSGRPSEELYDLESDPHEQQNLAVDPRHRDTLERFRAAHDAWQRETRDLGMIPEPHLRELEAVHGTQFDILRNEPDPMAAAARLVRAAEAKPESSLGRLKELRERLAAGKRDEATEALTASLLESPHAMVPLAGCDIMESFHYLPPRAAEVLRRVLKRPESDEYVARVAARMAASPGTAAPQKSAVPGR